MPKLSPRLLALAPFALLVLGCSTTGVDMARPTLDLPALQQGIAEEDLTQWWTRFEDPALTAFIERALVQNADLKVAAARVAESAALLRVSRAALLPDAGIALGASRSRATEVGAQPHQSGTPLINNSFTAGLEVSYEVDLWGRIRSGNDAALAELAASREAQNGLRSALAAQIAQNWFNRHALDHKIALARDTLATREEAVHLQQRLFDAGNSGPLSLRQAEAEREAVAALLPRLIAARASSERALAVLAGESPRAIVASGMAETSTGKSGERLPLAPAVPEGLNSDLLSRRPDIREAEAHLLTSRANVAVAQADFFPRISLTGSYGRESKDLSDLFTGPATVWNIAGSLLQPLIAAGRIQAQVNAAEARRQQAEARYVATVQGAFREVYDSLGNLRAANDTVVAQEKQAAALREALRIAQRRYSAGLSSYLEVLDAQRNLLNTETSLIETQTQQLTATVDVFRALGGGWSKPTNPNT